MRPLRVLSVEDSNDDFAFLRRELERAGYAPQMERVETALEMRRALDEQPWDLVLSDYQMPRFDALAALEVLQASGQRDVPFIIVSGTIGEQRAVDVLKAGASNYVLKDNLGKLVPVVERELADAQTRRERAQAVEALELAVRSREEFLFIASHELKTPLTALTLNVQRLLKMMPGAEPAVLAKAQAVERSARRMAQLVDRMLEISRVSAGRLDLCREGCDLASLVKASLTELEPLFTQAGSKVTLTTTGSCWGHWDKERLETVIANLLVNAAKFGNGQPIEVELDGEGSSCRLRVVDHGIGISPKDQKRIFGRFERAVPKQHYGGFGLGLWLSHRIVRAHGGTLEVTSAPDQGSTFTVTLAKAAA